MRSLRTSAAAWPRARAVSGEHKQAWGQVAEVEEHPPSLLRLPLRTARRRSASSLSPRRPGHAKGEGGAFTHPQGPAARSRSREQGAPLFAHVPRSLAPPATSPRRSTQLRYIPAEPVAHVARKAQEACSLAPKDVAPLANRSRSCLRRRCRSLAPFERFWALQRVCANAICACSGCAVQVSDATAYC